MKRSYSNGKLSFWTKYRKTDICLYQIELKKNFEYETETLEGQTIDTIIKNDKEDTALYFISNNHQLIALQSITVDGQDATYPVILFDEKMCCPAIQEDTLILITPSKNALQDFPVISECINEVDRQFFNRENICEIYTNDNFQKIEYHNRRMSQVDKRPNFFHFNHNFDEIYASYATDECRISRWTYHIGQKNEYTITQCDDTQEYYIYHTHTSERLKYHLTRPKTILTWGILAIFATLAIKECRYCSKEISSDIEPKLIRRMEMPHSNTLSHTH